MIKIPLEKWSSSLWFQHQLQRWKWTLIIKIGEHIRGRVDISDTIEKMNSMLFIFKNKWYQHIITMWYGNR